MGCKKCIKLRGRGFKGKKKQRGGGFKGEKKQRGGWGGNFVESFMHPTRQFGGAKITNALGRKIIKEIKTGVGLLKGTGKKKFKKEE